MHTLYWRPNVCHYCSLNGISGIQFTVVLYYCITRKLGLQISLDLQHFHRIFFHQNMHFFFNFKKALASSSVSSLRRQCFISKGSFELFFLFSRTFYVKQKGTKDILWIWHGISHTFWWIFILSSRHCNWYDSTC